MLVAPAIDAVEREARRAQLALVSGSYRVAEGTSYEGPSESVSLWPLLDEGGSIRAVVVAVDEIGYRSRLRLLIAVDRDSRVTAFSIPERFESPSVERVLARPATETRMARGEIDGLSGATITADAIARAHTTARVVARSYFREVP